MRRMSWLAGIVAAAVMLVPLRAIHAAKDAQISEHEHIYKQLELFEHALSIVRSDYVEQPKAEQLVYGALKGMLATLDPYSQFLDPDSYTELKVDTEGEFGGLGIEITIKDDLLTIISPIDDTPAFRAGLQPGDRIVKIDGALTRGITVNDAVKKLRGKPKTKVTLTILREGEAALHDVPLERDVIKIQSVREAVLLEDHIAYVRLSDFREKSAEDLETALKKLDGEHMDAMIFDLRNNPGGLLDVAVSIAELFLERNQLIVSTKGRLNNQNQELRARMTGPVRDIPMVVLINEGSASASEIVAGAIQDHHRGVIIGTKSHGKASVQTIFPLKDGSALRLTTSKYFTPSGRLIEGKGIAPDVEVVLDKKPPLEDAEKEKGKESKKNAEDVFIQIEAGKNPGEAPAAKKPQDNQIARAIDLLKGIKVYQTNQKGHAVN